ncbi:MAG: YqaA family protein [Rikenellaceae bacterium]
MDFLIEWGYLGMFISAFLAATVIPFSSDVVLVGLIAAGGDTVWLVVLATLGNWIGGLTSYYLGYMGKMEWIEKYFKVKHETLEKQRDKINKWGASLAFMSWLPGVGDVFAIALGFYKVDPKKCAIYMFLGKGLRFIAWAVIFQFFS